MTKLRHFETTLSAIRTHSPSKEFWTRLLKNLGKTDADGEPLDILTILDRMSIDEALWCLRACDGIDRETRLFIAWSMRQTVHLFPCHRTLDAIDLIERYANGEATDEDLVVSLGSDCAGSIITSPGVAALTVARATVMAISSASGKEFLYMEPELVTKAWDATSTHLRKIIEESR